MFSGEMMEGIIDKLFWKEKKFIDSVIDTGPLLRMGLEACEYDAECEWQKCVSMWKTFVVVVLRYL